MKIKGNIYFSVNELGGIVIESPSITVYGPWFEPISGNYNFCKKTSNLIDSLISPYDQSATVMFFIFVIHASGIRKIEYQFPVPLFLPFISKNFVNVSNIMEL